MITISNLVVGYGKNNKVIDDLNLNLDEGLIHGIVGLNGAGKTTLLNSLYGLKRIDGGNILHNDKAINKKSVSYLTSENYFYSDISGREYLSLFGSNDFDIEKWNDLFKLPLDNIVNEYSTGMKKKLAILAVIKQGKQIIILDEPFNGLDIETIRIIRMILLRLKQGGKTIIITSHIIETLSNLCDLIHYLDKGKIFCSYDKTKFGEFEQEVFSKIENKNSDIVDKLIPENQ